MVSHILHTDLLHNYRSPLPTSQGHHCQFTVIDLSTHWPEAITMQTATSASCIPALLSGWIVRFGIPKHITFDRDTTFASQLLTSLANLLDIIIHPTNAYNTAADRMVAHFYCTLKAALMCGYNNSNLFTQLPLVLLVLRITPKDTLDVSAIEMVVPVEFIHLQPPLKISCAYVMLWGNLLPAARLASP
ncbi:uncharacterized protein [Palaemon carinicauda]|uniref:uncharacterized protein n=1 Tax=Palaemon carinicauda TaxID=392227 RepID=UPI0035B6302E